MLSRLVIANYRKFANLDFKLDPELNIIVGDNDSGKSTILQAIEMVLGGRIGGRPIEPEISPHWFNQEVAQQYCNDVQVNKNAPLPSITIEAYLSDVPSLAALKGRNNSLALDTPGLRIEISFDPRFDAEYQEFLTDPTKIKSTPIEFYSVQRFDFAGQGVSGSRSLVSCALIDASTLRLQSGADYYLRKVINEHLTDDVRARMTLALRTYRENLADDPAFQAANEALAVTKNALSKSTVKLSPDSSTKNSWEAGITPHMDGVPFAQVGKGEQAAFKILLALDKNSAPRRDSILIEEPENHLSYSSLNILIERIRDRSAGQQLVITTHSSFVLNKLGVDKLRLLGNSGIGSMLDLPPDTHEYFRKLAGFDTLRLVLARAVILVEGPSDEITVQKAYLQRYGILPLEAGIDIISVQSLAFRRFLQLGQTMGKKIAVITDLDDDSSQDKARKRFSDFENPQVRGFVGAVADGRTLEPQLISSAGRELLNQALGKSFPSDDELADYLAENKTELALALLDYDDTIPMPKHIEDAIAFVQ